jgi:hypothetical protein
MRTIGLVSIGGRQWTSSCNCGHRFQTFCVVVFGCPLARQRRRNCVCIHNAFVPLSFVFLNLLIIRWVQILHRIIEHQLRKFATKTKNLKENNNFRIFVSNKSLSSPKLSDMNLPMSQHSYQPIPYTCVLSAQRSTLSPFWYSHRSDSSEDSVTAWRSALLTGPHRIANVDWKLKHSK